MYEVAAVRREIPGVDARIYLNTGGLGLMPTRARQEIQECYARLGRALDPTSWYLECNERAVALRAQIGAFVGAEADEIALKTSVADGYGTVLWGLDWREGDEVITSSEEHPAPRLAIELAARQFGLRVKTIPVNSGGDEFVAELRAALSPRTRLVAMSHVTTDSGTRLPAEEICQLSHAVGALVLFDGAHAVGQFPLDLHQLDCDFYACMGYKWALGPMGSGFLYVRRDRQGELRPIIGSGAVRWLSLPEGRFEEGDTARRFEFASRSWPEYFALGRALEFLDGVGITQIQEYTRSLVHWLRDQLDEIDGVQIHTPKDPRSSTGILAFSVADVAPQDLSRALREHREIYQRAAMMVEPSGGVRVSVALYTTVAELEQLVTAVREIAAHGPRLSAGT